MHLRVALLYARWCCSAMDDDVRGGSPSLIVDTINELIVQFTFNYMSDLMLTCAMMSAVVCVSATVACVAVYIMGSYRILIASHLAHTELRTRITRF